MYWFDEGDPASREPLGATTPGMPLALTLRYRRGFCRCAYVVWRIDGGDAHEQPMPWRETVGENDIFFTRLIAPKRGLYWYWFRIETADGSFTIDRNGPRDEATAPYQLTVHDEEQRTPDWIKGGVMYHIFVDRYASGGSGKRVMKPGSVLRNDWGGQPVFLPDEEGIVRNNDFFGGNLEGIIEKLPRLQSQGVTCLYLSPVFEAASNHKYDTGDYMKIDPGFGSEAVLRRLCIEAKNRGMRVILDGVFSHVGTDSVYFNRYGNYDSVGAYQSADSPFYPWFMFKEWPDTYESWWGIDLLPVIDKRNPSYRDYITGRGGVIRHWMDCGVSGWRLDVVDELPDDFLDPLCAAARRGHPEALIVGEVWEDASNKIAYGNRRRYLLGGQLDSVMNYPLKDAIISFVRNKNADALADTMSELTRNYPKQVLDSLMNILGTHDTMRILTALGGDHFPDTREKMSRYRLSDEQRREGKKLLKIASALQFTLPGFPCVYYGDEAGMEGGADPFNRVCYPWGKEDDELLSWYRQLASIRLSLPAFKDGSYRLVAAREGVFAFTRGAGEETVLVAANVKGEDVRLPFEDFRYDLIEKKTNNTCVAPGEGVAIYIKGSK